MWSTGINRNIVECKEKNLHTEKDLHIVLIETLWNVKKIDTKNVKSAVNVLIETLWNVKFCRGTEMHRPVLVLIETLWNVKIMEVSGSMLSLKVVLIETLWNVK